MRSVDLTQAVLLCLLTSLRRDQTARTKTCLAGRWVQSKTVRVRVKVKVGLGLGLRFRLGLRFGFRVGQVRRKNIGINGSVVSVFLALFLFFFG